MTSKNRYRLTCWTKSSVSVRWNRCSGIEKISDILVNDKDHVFIEKGGLLQRVDTTFRDDRHLLQIIDRIVSRVGRRVDESSADG